MTIPRMVYGAANPETHGLPSLAKLREQNDLRRMELDAALRGPVYLVPDQRTVDLMKQHFGGNDVLVLPTLQTGKR